MAKVKPTNKVRFAWWGAEESGLLGSEHYVAELTEEEADDIALYLNFDMVASPNYTFGIYDGDNSGGTAASGLHPAGLGRRSRTCSSGSTPPRGEPFTGHASSPAAPTTARSSPSAFPPAACSPAPRCPRRRPRQRSTAASRARVRPVLPRVLRQPDVVTARTPRCTPRCAEDYELVGNINVHALDVELRRDRHGVLTFAYDTSSVNAVAGKPGKSNGLYKLGETR